MQAATLSPMPTEAFAARTLRRAAAASSASSPQLPLRVADYLDRQSRHRLLQPASAGSVVIGKCWVVSPRFFGRVLLGLSRPSAAADRFTGVRPSVRRGAVNSARFASTRATVTAPGHMIMLARPTAAAIGAPGLAVDGLGGPACRRCETHPASGRLGVARKGVHTG